MSRRVFGAGAFALSLLLGIAGMASTQQGDLPSTDQPCVYPRMDQVDARLRARVASMDGRFGFEYSLENGPAAGQVLDSFAVQAFPAVNMRPVQVTPADWRSLGEISNTGFYIWYMRGGARGLARGVSAEGFGFTEADLPTIVTFLAWGKVEPPSFPAGMAPESCEGTNVLENSFKGKTIGPKAPPAPFVPLEFLNYLIALLHDSREQGWVTGDGIHQSLLAKLLAAKRSLEAGRPEPVRGQLQAFLHEVEAVACPQLACPGETPLTSEAYALLAFNGHYLRERLPGSR